MFSWRGDIIRIIIIIVIISVVNQLLSTLGSLLYILETCYIVKQKAHTERKNLS